MTQPHLLTTLISNTLMPYATPIILLDTFIFYFNLIVHHIKESLIRMDVLPLQVMTLHDLHIISTHLSFISKLSFTHYTHQEKNYLTRTLQQYRNDTRCCHIHLQFRRQDGRFLTHYKPTSHRIKFNTNGNNVTPGQTVHTNSS